MSQKIISWPAVQPQAATLSPPQPQTGESAEEIVPGPEFLEAHATTDLQGDSSETTIEEPILAPLPASGNVKKVIEILSKAGDEDVDLSRILQREVITNPESYPFRCAGKVYVGKDGDFTRPIWRGSGVLVGRNLLLTASHVAPWNPAGGALPGWWMKFIPAYHNGVEPYSHSYVKQFRGIRNTSDVTGVDYVICQLYDALGDRTGYLGYQSYGNEDDYKQGRWTSIGYPGDFQHGEVPLYEQSVVIHDVDDESGDGKELEADTFSSPGWSGGPMYGTISGQQRVIGVMSGKEFESDGFLGIFGPRHWHSVSAGGKNMSDLIKYGRDNWQP